MRVDEPGHVARRALELTVRHGSARLAVPADGSTASGRVDMRAGTHEVGDALWLLACVAGVVEIRGSQATGGEDEWVADLVRADALTAGGLALPVVGTIRELRRVALSVGLDAVGRLVRIDLSLGGMRASARLSDFGEPSPAAASSGDPAWLRESPVPPPPEASTAAREVVSSLRATLSRRTARFVSRMTFPGLGEAHGRPPAIDENAGRIDFGSRAFEQEGDPTWVVKGDRIFERDAHGGLRQLSRGIRGGADRPASGTPFWLLDALAGTLDAAPDGSGSAGGQRLHRYRCAVDLVTADELSPAGLVTPPLRRVRDLRSAEVTVVIDDAGALRGVFTSLGAAECGLWLEALGAPDTIGPA